MWGMFETILQSAYLSLPTFALHLFITLVMLIAGVVIYTLATPINEQKLIAAGNVAASVSFGAIVLSLAIPLAFCLKASSSVAEIVVWGAVAVVLQLLAFGVATLVFRDMSRRIEAGDMAASVALSATNLAVAALTAAAISG